MDALAIVVAVVAAVWLGLVLLAWRRRTQAVQAAALPVLVDGRPCDAAAVLWSFRQVNESPHLSALAGEDVTTTSQLVGRINATMSTLPPGHAAEVVAALLRLGRAGQFQKELIGSSTAVDGRAPMLGDDAILTLCALEPGVGAGLHIPAPTPMVAGVTPHLGERFPPPDRTADLAGRAASEHGAVRFGHLLNAHAPFVSLVVAIKTAGTSFDSGLDPNRVAENAKWDVGATGGSMLAGAGLGTLLLPGIGTVVGGLGGLIGGTVVATHGKRRHLRAAIIEFRASCAQLGEDIKSDHLAQLCDASGRLLELKAGRLAELEADIAAVRSRQSWFTRTFRPTVGLAVAARTIELAQLDLQIDRERHVALSAHLNRAGLPPTLRGYAWVAAHTLLDWADLSGPDPARQLGALDAVRSERTNLKLARG